MIIGSREWLEAVRRGPQPQPKIVSEEKSWVDLWANFLKNEKLGPERIQDDFWIMEMVRLCEALAKKCGPKISPYKLRLESRALVCEVAMDLGIDLPAIKNHYGKTLMARSLLDAWNLAYQKRHGSTIGTASAKEAKRRDIKTKLSKEKSNDRRHCGGTDDEGGTGVAPSDRASGEAESSA